jgi:predicted nucleotidyltransferase component of viral defense system
MLYFNTVKPDTLELLNKIMEIPELINFNLAGGTSLSLQIGHRLSVDLDLFGKRPFNQQEILDLVSSLGNVRQISYSKNIFVLNINDIKVDFVNYKYPLLKEIRTENSLRLFSLEDIAAMKIAAVTGRGRKRDFTDLFFILKYFTLTEILSFYNEKYPDGNELMAARSLTYFSDADEDEDMSLFKKAPWNVVKKSLEKAVRETYK